MGICVRGFSDRAESVGNRDIRGKCFRREAPKAARVWYT